MLQQLRDLVAFANAVRLVTEVLHEHDDLATVTGVNHSGVAHQALAGQSRARLHDTARRGQEFDGDAGVDARSTVRGNSEVFAGIEIVSDVLSRMRYRGQNSIRREPLHS